jgi:hypothetical protein
MPKPRSLLGIEPHGELINDFLVVAPDGQPSFSILCGFCKSQERCMEHRYNVVDDEALTQGSEHLQEPFGCSGNCSGFVKPAKPGDTAV